MKRHEYKLEGKSKGVWITFSLRSGYIWIGNDNLCEHSFIGTITNKRTLRAIGKRLLAITKQPVLH